jgi:hypothetical protein
VVFRMTKRLRSNWDELKVLRKAKPKLRKSILRAAENDLITCLSECSHNVLNGNIQLSKKDKKALAKHSKALRALAKRKASTSKRRQILVQKGGFLPALLGPIIAVASTLLSGLVK